MGNEPPSEKALQTRLAWFKDWALGNGANWIAHDEDGAIQQFDEKWAQLTATLQPNPSPRPVIIPAEITWEWLMDGFEDPPGAEQSQYDWRMLPWIGTQGELHPLQQSISVFSDASCQTPAGKLDRIWVQDGLPRNVIVQKIDKANCSIKARWLNNILSDDWGEGWFKAFFWWPTPTQAD